VVPDGHTTWSGAVTGTVCPVSMTVVSLLIKATTADSSRNSPTARARVARTWPVEMLSTEAPAATSVA
jgi:hypothetical protein